MNTNMFEKPIAANPISQFSTLPLQFINQLQQQKAQKEVSMIAMEDEISNSLMGTSALPGDAKRHQEIIGGLESELDVIASNAGDYSEIQGKLQSIKRKVYREMRNGELGSINNNFKAAASNREEQMKNFRAGKASKAGITLSMQGANTHVTTRDEFGQWSSFRPYQPSTVTDFYGELTKSAKDIQEQYDEMGQGMKSNEAILSNLTAKLVAKPEIESAMKENFNLQYTPKEDINKQQSYLLYKNEMLSRIVKDQAFQKISESEAGSGNTGGLILDNFKVDGGGSSSMKGGTVPWLREVGKDWLGLDSTGEFDKWKNSEKGKFEIKHLQQLTGTTMPKDHTDAVSWYEDNMQSNLTTSISTSKVPANLKYSIINKKGFINVNSIIKNRNGEAISEDFIQNNIAGSDKDGRTAQVFAIANEGTGVSGEYVIIGKDGEQYLMEPRDAKTLTSAKYMNSKIFDVQSSSVRSGIKNVTLSSNLNATDNNGNDIVLDAGQYEVRNETDKKGNSQGVKLYQDGKPMYAGVKRQNTDGTSNIIYVKLSNGK
jgi:hypothetical protein